MERHAKESCRSSIINGSFDPSDMPAFQEAAADIPTDLHQHCSISVSMAQPLVDVMQIDRKSSEQAFPLQAAIADQHQLRFSTSPNLLHLNILDIMRESSALLRLNATALTSIMFILICPLSALLLSSPWLLQQLRHSHFHLHAHIHSLAATLGILHSSLFKSLLSPLSKLLLSYALSSPIFFTFWLLAKAFIIFTVSATYSARKPSFELFISVGPKLWKRLLYTNAWIGCCAVLIFAIATFTLSVVTALARGLQLSAGTMLAAEMAMGIGSSVLLANALVCADMASVVCVLEENVGVTAMARAMRLMKGKMQVALWMVLVTAGSMAMVESLYTNRVIGVEGGRYEISAVTRLWEAPLLICMHAFLLLYHAIMTTVFYFTCKPPSSAHQPVHIQLPRDSAMPQP
ncbi:hypothetical protein L7F22_054278 [Adiantum nelumboides]|nr:hypothetical protein [Adiantum nelumboides]